MIKYILSVDLGTISGYSVFDTQLNKVIKHGVIDSNAGLLDISKALDNGQKYGRQYINFYRHLVDLFDKYDNAVIVYEKVFRHIGIYAAHRYGGFEGQLFTYAASRNLSVVHYSVSAIKKAFTGNGRAKKADIIAKCRSLGYNVLDDNEADAIAIAYCHASKAIQYHSD